MNVVDNGPDSAAGPKHVLRRGVRPQVAEIPFSLIGQVSIPRLGDPDIIPLWYGESDMPTPAVVVDAAEAAMRAGHTHYAQKQGIPELRAALAEYLSDLYGRPMDAERTSVTSSGMSAIMIATQALIQPGDNAVAITPLWPNLVDCVRALGAEPRMVALQPTKDGGWHLDLDRVIANFDDNTRCVFVNSPNNPTGWVMSRAEAEALLAETRKRGIYLIADEVYARLVYGPARAAPSLMEIADPEDRMISINSFSKAWAMTGWRLGWMVAPKEVRDVLDTLIEINTSCAPPFIQHAGVAALKKGEGFVTEMRERCRLGRDLTIQGLSRFPRVHVAAPAGAFYAFFTVDGITDDLAFAHKLADEAKVGLAPGSAFGPAGAGYTRLCYAKSPALLEQALDRLAPFLS
ncbi:MAG TPA: pyridoxal phosphate-dependent aminotransferase [Magnetospirillaceae bacterium]